MKKIVCSCVLLGAALLASGGEIFLMKNGKAKCSIVLRKDATPPEKLAARELATYLARISGGEKPVVDEAPQEGKTPVFLELTDDPKVDSDGFKISSAGRELHIAGREGVGVLYGVYDILQRYGGIRWLVPGSDGEYFKIKPAIAVPEGVKIKNPDFKNRNFSLVCMNWFSKIPDTIEWSARNFMRFRQAASKITDKRIGPIRVERGIRSTLGGHCFTPLFLGTGKNKTTPEKLFAEHPEYFPLIHGKRVITRHGGGQPQPCTTHPEVIRRVARSIIDLYKDAPKPCIISFGNNDFTQWCQCENCLKIDPPEEKEKGYLSTRYWTFANAVVDLVKKEAPDILFEGWSYQNYSRAPKVLQPDKRVEQVMISNHRRCWKHALDDKDCPTNQWYYEYNKEWNEKGVPFYSYDELSYAGYNFLPNEKPWIDVLKYYKKNMPNYTGTCTEICCPDGEYGKRYKTYRTLNNWYMMWQAVYLAAAFHWDIGNDYDKLYEEINSLYYGKGWEGGMREFRKTLTDLYMNAGGCWGYGHSVPVGKFLDVPGAKEKLYKLLDSAEKAASEDPDKRALAHVKRDREFFEVTWVKAYNEYVKNYREIKLYPLMGKIEIDGRLEEKDWKNADVTTRFRAVDGKEAECQTAVKLAYDKENLYVGVECLEPAPDKVCCLPGRKHDGGVWEDNGVELFLNDPILGGSYFQIIINSDGAVCDGLANPQFSSKWDSSVEVKTSKGKDRWFLEAKIPAKSITGSVFSPGTVLRMNVMRHRVWKEGEKRMSEISTWSMGYPHNVEVFHPISFATPRNVTAGNRQEMDTRLWKNGSFNEVDEKRQVHKNWTKAKSRKLPRNWSLSSSYTGEYDYLLHPGSKDNYYVRLSGGYIASNCGLRSPKIAMSMRLRGKGTLWICMLRYTKGFKKNIATTRLKTLEVDSEHWKNYSFVVDRPGDKDEEQVLMFWPNAKNAVVEMDDIFVSPRE